MDRTLLDGNGGRPAGSKLFHKHMKECAAAMPLGPTKLECSAALLVDKQEKRSCHIVDMDRGEILIRSATNVAVSLNNLVEPSRENGVIPWLGAIDFCEADNHRGRR